VRPDRRERVGGEREVLAARLIDRAVRPLLPPGFLYDTQVGGTSSALHCSDIQWYLILTPPPPNTLTPGGWIPAAEGVLQR